MKERKISRRAVCSAMVASLALGVLEGCGSSSSTTASSAAGSGAAASNERITVRILKSKAANEVAAEQMDVWKVLGEKFNMDFEFDNPPQDNYNERLNLVMMDAQLPDIIMDMPTTEVLKYGESGVILSLNDYIENDMPNLKKEIDKRDGVEKALTYSDGNIYYMPMLDEKVSGNMPYIVRTDWLEKLGIESPVTLEDWENYWHLVKTTDLNGNGTNDEIPFSSYDMARGFLLLYHWGLSHPPFWRVFLFWFKDFAFGFKFWFQVLIFDFKFYYSVSEVSSAMRSGSSKSSIWQPSTLATLQSWYTSGLLRCPAHQLSTVR